MSFLFLSQKTKRNKKKPKKKKQTKKMWRRRPVGVVFAVGVVAFLVAAAGADVLDVEEEHGNSFRLIYSSRVLQVSITFDQHAPPPTENSIDFESKSNLT